MTVERRWSYRASWWTLLWSGAFFALCATLLAHNARTNDRGLILNGIIELGVTRATTFYWILAACSALFVCAALVVAVHRSVTRQRVAIASGVLFVPAGRWSSRENAIPLREIKQVSVLEISGQRFIQLFHRGRKYTIVGSMLPAKADLGEILALITPRADAGR